jgi:hypothetical protein
MKHLRNWGAVWILAALFLGSWVGQFYTQLDAVTQDAKAHGERFLWADFWPQFWSATFENWQSEFLQLGVQAVLIASVLQRFTFNADFGADKDDVERIEAKLDTLLGDRR